MGLYQLWRFLLVTVGFFYMRWVGDEDKMMRIGWLLEQARARGSVYSCSVNFTERGGASDSSSVQNASM